MMTQRNVELQLQALDLIERRHNSQQKDDADDAESTNVARITNENESGAGEGLADVSLAKLQ